MGDGSTIEWTDATWNPVRGCSRVSEGCRNCYAEGVARRFSGPGQPYEGLVRLDAEGRAKAQWNGSTRFVPEHLADPIRWRRPRRIFVNSMSDLFHESLPFEQIAAVFGVMAAAPQHRFQVLTKRPERAREFFAWIGVDSAPALVARDAACRAGAAAERMDVDTTWPLHNVDVGVSVEDQRTADERIPVLLSLRAHVGGALWCSYEPALGPVDFEDHLRCARCGSGAQIRCADPCTPTLDWIVAGSESGPRARPASLDWYRAVRDACVASGTAFFFKQHIEDGRKVSLPELDDVRWAQYPEAR